MAQLTPINFETKYNDATTGEYRNGQGTGAITPEDHRKLVTDIKDSFKGLFELHVQSVDFSITPQFQFEGKNNHYVFVGEVGADYDVSVNNTGYASQMTFLLNFTGIHTLTLSDFSMPSGDPRWDSGAKEFTPLETGIYIGKAISPNGGVNWFLEVSQNPYV